MSEIDEQTRDEIAAYVKERDRLLLSDDPADWDALFALAGEGKPSTPEACKMAVMVARSGAKSLPADVQEHAHRWLVYSGKAHLSLWDGFDPFRDPSKEVRR